MTGASEAIEIKTNELNGKFLSKTLGILGARLLENLPAGKSIVRVGEKKN